MSNLLNKARILSSENDASVKQEQNTNVEIKIKPSRSVSQPTVSQSSVPLRSEIPVFYPRVGTESTYPNVPLPPEQNRGVNFTIPTPDSVPSYSTTNSQSYPASSTRYPYQPQTNNIPPESSNILPPTTQRSIVDLGNHIVSEGEVRNELETLEMKNKFLELLVEMYSENPLMINSYVVCKSTLLMNMIKLLTGCDKVDFVLDNNDIGCGCSLHSPKLIKIDKILVTKDGKSEELKYAYNNIYTEFIKYGVSLKLCV